MKRYLPGMLYLCGLCLLCACGSGSQRTQPLAIISPAPPAGTTGSAYAGAGFLLAATGGVAPYNWSWAPVNGSALPAGLTLSKSNGMISGTPATANAYNVVVTVADSQSPAAQKSLRYTININAGTLVITSGSPPSGTVGAAYAGGGFPVTASGGSGPYSWSWAGAAGSILPPGLTLADGMISGTPTTPNTYNVVVTVADSQTPPAQTPANYTITVNAQSALVITTGPLPAGRVGSVYGSKNGPGFPLAATGGVAPYHWSWTGAPPGLSIRAGQCCSYCPSPGWQICGKPTTSGAYNVVITVTDSASPTNHTTQGGFIPILPGPLAITTTSVAVGAMNLPYSFAFSATGGYRPYTWSETGALPPGLNLAADGTLSGTATATGSFPITVSVADSHSQSTTLANFTVQIAAHGFKNMASLVNQRGHHTATLLADGRVLVAGGWGTSSELASTELYDPSIRSFSLAGSMSTARAYHTATLLHDGRVLVAGGGLPSAEIYGPSSSSFVSTGSMQVDRASHSATLLQDGRVLIAGGTRADGTILATAEIFNPTSGTFTATGSMLTARSGHTATLLSNGEVLITGGLASPVILDSAELYDPASGLFKATGNMSTLRTDHTATWLPSNTVLVAGGAGGNSALADIYNPATGTFATTGNLVLGVSSHTATLLANGQVLVTGGFPGGAGAAVSTAQLFDPAAGTFTLTGSMNATRFAHTATLLNDGTVLVVGGDTLGTAELYQ